MSEPDFFSVEQRLVREGVLPGFARRLTLELAEHYDDLAGMTHAGVIARWTACLVLSATFSAALMLMLQMSLALR